MAGGDGSLAAVAEVAIERDLPFVCIPFGTRNHFARDIGLDRDDPIGALAAFEGDELRIDIGRVGERLFLNNVSLGLYALLVHRRERHRRRRDALARLRALLLVAREHRGKDPFVIDGEPRGRTGRRRRRQRLQLRAALDRRAGAMDDGRLHLYVPHGFRRITWDERSCTELTIETAGSVGSRGDRRRAGAARVAGRAPDRAAGATRAGAAFARVRGSRRRSRRRARPARAARPARTSEARRGRRPAAPFLLRPGAIQVRQSTVRPS